MVFQRCTRLLFVAVFILSLSLHPLTHAQEIPKQRQQVQPRPRLSLALSFGLTSPRGRAGLRDFWLNGPGATALLHVHLNPMLAVGLGGDVSILYFNERAFGERFPAVVLKEKDNLLAANVYLDATCSFRPGYITRPFLSVQVGIHFMNEATFQEIVGGVRHTYYKVGGKSRLTMGGATGVNIHLSRGIGLIFGFKGTYIHNDPNVNFLVHLRAGIQFRL